MLSGVCCLLVFLNVSVAYMVDPDQTDPQGAA